MLDDIAILTARQVTGAYKSYISPDRLTLIAAGDAADPRRTAPGAGGSRPAPGNQPVSVPAGLGPRPRSPGIAIRPSS